MSLSLFKTMFKILLKLYFQRKFLGTKYVIGLHVFYKEKRILSKRSTCDYNIFFFTKIKYSIAGNIVINHFLFLILVLLYRSIFHYNNTEYSFSLLLTENNSILFPQKEVFIAHDSTFKKAYSYFLEKINELLSQEILDSI